MTYSEASILCEECIFNSHLLETYLKENTFKYNCFGLLEPLIDVTTRFLIIKSYFNGLSILNDEYLRKHLKDILIILSAFGIKHNTIKNITDNTNKILSAIEKGELHDEN